jgi:uncharacterized protein YjbJ (UPF0337 family)
MISQQELSGSWGELKGKIKEKWGQITDNELTQAEGNVERIVGMIQRKTGTARREIEDFFDQAVGNANDVMGRVASTAQNYAQQASQAVSQGYDQVSDQVQQGYEQAEEMIRTRPAESLTVAFGAGIVTGILVTLMMRSR